MGDVIRFPVERLRAHVALSWDWSVDQYRIQALGIKAGTDTLEFCTNTDEAWDCFISMGERFGLPLIDCTSLGFRLP